MVKTRPSLYRSRSYVAAALETTCLYRYLDCKLVVYLDGQETGVLVCLLVSPTVSCERYYCLDLVH